MSNTLADAKRPAESLRTFDELLARFGDDPSAAVGESVADALLNIGDLHGELGETPRAIACFDQVVERYGDRAACAAASRTRSRSGLGIRPRARRACNRGLSDGHVTKEVILGSCMSAREACSPTPASPR
jgi:tetratricopeptide (TPR) repeat protein